MPTNGPTTLNFESWMRDMEKRMQRQERRLGGVSSATITGDGGGVRVTDPDSGGATVLTPPSESPQIAVTPMATGVMVVATNVAPSTLIAYRVDGEVVRQTRSTAEFLSNTADGLPMGLDIEYTIDVIAYNDAGSAAPSDPWVGKLDPSVDPAFVRGIIEAGFILAGTIQVGNITIRPGDATDPGGITIPLSNGGVIDFPADGSDALITAMLRARSLLVENHLTVQGDVNTIEGGVVLADGVSAPNVLPRAGTSWDHAAASVPLTYFGSGDPYDVTFGTNAGGFYDSGFAYKTLSLFGGSVQVVDPVAGTLTNVFNTPSQYSPIGGVVKIGTNFYTLGFDGNRGNRWFVYKFNSTGTKLLEWEFTQLGSGPKFPQMVLNGSNLMIVYWTLAGSPATIHRVLATTFIPDTGVQTGSSVLCDDPTSGLYDLKYAYYGPGPWGGTNLVAVGETIVRVFTVSGTTGTRDATKEWRRPNGDYMHGGWYDGTRWNTIGLTGKIWHYSVNYTTTARSITYTKYDSAGTTHETPASPPLSYSQLPGEWLRVDTDPPGYGGDPDDPDSVRIYIANHRMPDLGVGVTTAIYDSVSAAGSAAPTTSTFPAVLVPGNIQSQAEDLTGKLTQLWGDGDYRLAGTNLDDVPATALTSAIAFNVGGVVQYQVVNGFVIVSINMTATTGTPFTSLAEVTLVAAGGVPSAYRPTVSSAGGARFTGGGLNSGVVSVLTDGSIAVINSGAAARSSLRSTVIYPMP